MEMATALKNPTWATRSALLAEVAKTSARLTESTDGSYDVAVEAPRGYVWNSGEVHEIVGSCPDNRGKARNLVRADVIERMRFGMVPCNQADCDWCDGPGAAI